MYHSSCQRFIKLERALFIMAGLLMVTHQRSRPAHEKLSAVRAAVSGFPLPPALKALTARNTGNAGWNNLRAPFVPLSDSDRDALFAKFDAAGAPMPAAT